MPKKIERLIGDFLELNAYIVQEEFNSKFPKFIAKIKSKKQRKRLLNNVEKIRNSGVVLNVDNLMEYFSYLVSNYYPETEFGAIIRCRVDEYSGLYEAVLSVEKQTAIITIDKAAYPKFNVSSRIITDNNTSEGINVQTEELQSDKYKKNKILSRINEILLNDICDFILEKIKPYQEDIKENEDGDEFVQIRID